MYGENLELITRQCCVCGRWFALRLDKDDLARILCDGVYVENAFTNRAGKPYLDADQRELYIPHR